MCSIRVRGAHTACRPTDNTLTRYTLHVCAVHIFTRASLPQLRNLGVPPSADELLLPWVQRLRNVHIGRNWGAGVHCCSALLPNMPSLSQWRRLARLPTWGPLRPTHLLDAWEQRECVAPRSNFVACFVNSCRLLHRRHLTQKANLAETTILFVTAYRFVGHYLGRKVDREMALETSDPEYRNFVEWFKVAHELCAEHSNRLCAQGFLQQRTIDLHVWSHIATSLLAAVVGEIVPVMSLRLSHLYA